MVATYIGTLSDDAQTSGFDFMYGLDGNDTLFLTSLALDVIKGGRGNDFIGVYSNSHAVGNLYGGDGTDILAGHCPDFFVEHPQHSVV